MSSLQARILPLARSFALLGLIGGSSLGCALSPHPTVAAEVDRPAAGVDLEGAIAEAGPIRHEVVISARWVVDRKGLVNLDHPEAKAAGLRKGDVPIVLPVHVLRHPERGLFVIDTGVSKARVNGEAEGAEGDGTRGLVASFLRGIEGERSLGSIVEATGEPLAGVLLTHMHLDHVLGLADVPKGTPIYTGPGESAARRGGNGLLRGTYRRIFAGHEVREWSFGAVDPAEPLAGAVDVFGDGSLWALPAPGHTPGSVAYLVRTTEGPRLIASDTSHTRWGFEHGVEPGTFTADHGDNARSLEALRSLASRHRIPTYVGHEEGAVVLGAEVGALARR